MVEFCINPLSASEQCFGAQDVARVVGNIVDCFTYLLPAIRKGRVKLIFDATIEERRLLANEHFLASINSLPRTSALRDVKVLWFTFTRNRAASNAAVRVEVSITSAEAAGEEFRGQIDEGWISDGGRWISFGGRALNEAFRIQLNSGEGRTSEVRNAHHLESIKLLMPRFEASPKHRAEPYFEAGVRISAMPLPDAEAQSLLLVSVIDGDRRWAYCERRKKCYRFNVTHVATDVYHGFEVENEDVPHHILPDL
jgi:hypothetical protein